jgi:hypothetical protein
MFILDPGSEYFQTGFRVQVKKIPNSRSGSALKNLSIFRPKNCIGKMIWDTYPGSGFFFSIPGPESRCQKVTGSRLRTRNTVNTANSNIPKTLGRVRGGATCTPCAAQRSTRNWSASADSSSCPGAGNCFPVALCSAGRNSTWA